MLQRLFQKLRSSPPGQTLDTIDFFLDADAFFEGQFQRFSGENIGGFGIFMWIKESVVTPT